MSSIRPRGNSFLLGLFLHSAVDDAGLGVYEFRVYAHLCRRAGDELRVWEGQKKIAAVCGISRAQVQRALYALQERGWIELEKDFREDGGQKPNNIHLIGPPQVSLTPPASERGTPRITQRHPPHLSEAAKGSPVEGHPSEDKNPPTPQGEREVVLPEWLPEEVWGEWLQYRRESKKAVTPTSARMLLKKLEGAKDKGHDPVSLIETAIARGWQGVVIPTDSPSKGSARRGGRPATQQEANERFMDGVEEARAAVKGIFHD